LLQATEFAPQLADAYTYLGNALSEVGNFNEARKAYQSSVRTAESIQSLPNPNHTIKQPQHSPVAESRNAHSSTPFGETASRCPLVRIFTTLVVVTIR
jgi:hypothetical protein